MPGVGYQVGCFLSEKIWGVLLNLISERQVVSDLGGEGQVRDEGLGLRPVEEAQEAGKEGARKSPEEEREAFGMDPRSGKNLESV